MKIDGKNCDVVKKMSTLPLMLTFSIEYRSFNKTKFEFKKMLNIKYYYNDLTTKQDYSYQLFAILIYMNTDQKQ